MNTDFMSDTGPDINTGDIEYIENGVLCINPTDYSGVVYDNNGNLCNASITHRFSGHNKIPKFTNKVKFINERVVFLGGGYIFSHFGHFLLEGLARAYPALDKSFQNKKFVVIVKPGTKKLPEYAMILLNGLGIAPENIILVYKSVRFAGIYVPPQASVITRNISPVMARVFDKLSRKLAKSKIKTYDKIYLSRSKMNDGRTFGEGKIEHIFAKNGYKIIWPETLPLVQQITLARGCRVMAGTAGTALHLSLFMKPGGTVVQLKRNKALVDNADIQNGICTIKKLDFIYIAASTENIPTPHFTSIPQIIGVTPYLKLFFDDNNFIYTQKDIAFDNFAHRQYEIQLQKYYRTKKLNKIIDFIARIISVFGISKYNRQYIREKIVKLLHGKKK